MRTVGMKTLKSKLSECVHAAAAGETVVITERGRKVAQLIPMPQPTESVIERGVREGWIRPAKRGPDWPPKGIAVPGLTLEEILADLDEARKDPWC
jgi:prevent-host-death family protein